MKCLVIVLKTSTIYCELSNSILKQSEARSCKRSMNGKVCLKVAGVTAGSEGGGGGGGKGLPQDIQRDRKRQKCEEVETHSGGDACSHGCILRILTCHLFWKPNC